MGLINDEQINIDNRDLSFGNAELNTILHSYTKPKKNDLGMDLTPIACFINFCEYTSYITDEELLNGAIAYIEKEVPLIIPEVNKSFNALKEKHNNEYSDKDWHCIKAIFFSLGIRCKVFMKLYNPPNQNFPFFYIIVKDRAVNHNLNFAKEVAIRNYEIDLKEKIKILPIEERKEIYNRRIESLRNLDFRYDTNISLKTINFLKESKEYLFDDAKNITKTFEQFKNSSQQNDIDKYFQSYIPQYLKRSTNKSNEDGSANPLFYGIITSDLLQQRDRELSLKENLKERHELLYEYNIKLFYLTRHIVQLFIAVNKYSNSPNSGITSIKIKESHVLDSVERINEYSQIIRFNVVDNEIDIALKIREYCIVMFDNWIFLLKTQFGIDIYKSPLKTHFEKVKKELQNSINIEELKLMNKLAKRSATTLDEKEVDKSKNNQLSTNKDGIAISEKTEKELHTHIFKGNSFEIWESMFISFAINESKKTDLRFMYEVMKYNKQIHENITLKYMTDWINELYLFSIEKLHYIDFKSPSNEKRMSVYKLIQ